MKAVLAMLILGVSVMAAQNASENVPKPKVVINLPPTIQSERVDVRYFMGGEFGGYGDFVRKQKNRQSYEIVAVQDGKPARGIKIIVYAPGCAFKTYEFQFKEVQEAQADFVCERLPRVTLEGQIVPKGILAGHQAAVRIEYLASWDHEFFGIMDGMVEQFELAMAPLDSDGNFSVELPDFSVDPVARQKRDQPELILRVVDQETLNPLADTLRFGAYGTASGTLKIQSWYPKLTIEAVNGATHAK